MIDAVLDRLSRLHPKLIDLSLDRVWQLLERLGNPQERLPPVVHVAGTNGKGSTVATLRALLEADGKRVHVYTSPHLVRFAERIRLAGAVLSDEEVLTLLEEVEEANAGRPVTFFEITTAAAFLAFSRMAADLVILETGLGGRLDATNVVDKPALTILTPIALDHQQFLGDTLAKIAAEKAGILKAGRPCVTAAQAPEAREVIMARAEELGCAVLENGRDFRLTPIEGAGMMYNSALTSWVLPRPILPGAFQLDNAALALAALDVLTEDATQDTVAKGIRAVQWPARIQRLTKGALARALPEGWELWLDGGHNPHAGQALAEHAAAQWADRPLYAVLGQLATKDVHGYLRPLAPHFAKLVTIAIPGEPNAISAEILAEVGRELGVDARPALSVDEAVAELAQQPGPARVLICGSLYLAGQVLAENG